MSSKASSDEIHLYPPQSENLTHCHATLRTDLLSDRMVRTVLKLLCILFPVAESRRFFFNKTCLWTKTHSEKLSAPFRDAEDFFSAVESVNTWLVSWSTSRERSPELQPAWATERGIPEEFVRQLSYQVITSLSESKSMHICLYDSSGQSHVLRVPSRASLSPPKPFSSNNGQTYRVESIETQHRFRDPLGWSILVRGPQQEVDHFVKHGLRLESRERLRSSRIIEAMTIEASSTLHKEQTAEGET